MENKQTTRDRPKETDKMHPHTTLRVEMKKNVVFKNMKAYRLGKNNMYKVCKRLNICVIKCIKAFLPLCVFYSWLVV